MPIAAIGAFAQEATDVATPLREALRAACPQAPRRLNRLIELALIGAHRCASGRALDPRTAIYMACTHGCLGDAVDLVANVVRGAPTMPVTFINVSSNMAGFYVASTLGLHSGNHVGSSNDFAWEATLALACASGNPALIGAVEEAAWPLDAHRVRLELARGASVLETSQWLLLEPDAGSRIGMLTQVEHHSNTKSLLESLREAPPAAGTRLQVSGAHDAGALAEIESASGLKVHPAFVPEGHTGMPAALHCLGFLNEASAGSRLLHLSAARSGAWYSIGLSKT